MGISITMKLLSVTMILVLPLVAFTLDVPQGYALTTPQRSTSGSRSCGAGQVRHVDGRCVAPLINRRLFVVDAPEIPASDSIPEVIHKPKVKRNIIFIRIPASLRHPEPIVLPPPEQQHIVYVLSKRSKQDRQVIEVPAPPPPSHNVFFVNYAHDENPTLAGGIDLHSALNAALLSGSVISGFSDNLPVNDVMSNTADANVVLDNTFDGDEEISLKNFGSLHASLYTGST